MVRFGMMAAAAVLVLAAATPASAAVNFLYARAQVEYHSDLSAGGQGVYFEDNNVSEGATPAIYKAEAHPGDSYLDLAYLGGDYSSIFTFVDAASGYMAADADAFAGLNAAEGYVDASYSYLFQYTFTVDTASTLTLNYYNGGTVSLSRQEQSALTHMFNQQNGTVTFHLEAGRQYGLSVGQVNNHVAERYTQGETSGTFSAAYDFAISPIAAPEPATWALMLSGFGLAGVALRRRPVLAA